VTLYIVQAEEGSGIPGIPSVFASRADADALYKDLWRDAFAGHRGYANVSKERKAEIDALMERDYFEENWPEDGGVRMWALLDSEVPDDIAIIPRSDAHEFGVMCSACLNEPFDVDLDVCEEDE